MTAIIEHRETKERKPISDTDIIPKDWKFVRPISNQEFVEPQHVRYVPNEPARVTQGIDHLITTGYNMDVEAGGIKHDSDKNRLEFIHPVFLERLGAVMTRGAQKYEAWNWYRGMSWSRVYGSLSRHMVAWYGGEVIDPDSGLPHLSCAAACVMMLNVFEEECLGEDDRPWIENNEPKT